MTESAEPPSQLAVPPSTLPRRKLSRRRLWLFRVMAVGLPFAFLLVVEIALRLCGAGQDLSLVIPVPGNPERLTHQFNESVDLLYYGRTALAGPEQRRFDLPKPTNTYRVVFLGASTVIGFPFPPELAFPRQAEILLERQEPGTNFEVLNAGIVSMNSFAVADLARQCLACDPDLIIVHSGHNEFYGPGGPASTALSLPPGLIRATYLLRSLRIVQLFNAAVSSRVPVDDDLLNILPRTLEVQGGGAVCRQAEQNLRDNLRRVVDVCRKGGVPVVLSTVASNVRDQSPMRAVWPEGTLDTRRPEWERLMDEGERRLDAKEESAALEVFGQAEAICGNHARLQYRKGQCFERLGRTEEARQAYVRARDEDACRFRAPSSFSAIVQEAAAGGKNSSASAKSPGTVIETAKDVIFLDVAAALDRIGNPAGAGYDLYLEHVHYNAEGHRQLGKIFARCVQQQARGREWDESLLPSGDEMEALLGTVDEDDLAAYSFSMQVMHTAPLRAALESARQDQFTSDQIARRFSALSKERREAFADLPMNAMAHDLMLPLAELHLARKQINLASVFSERAVLRRPWSPEAHLLNAKVRDHMGNLQGVAEALKNALALRPGWAPAVAYQAALSEP